MAQRLSSASFFFSMANIMINKKRLLFLLIGTGLALTGCGSMPVDRKELATIDPKQVLLELAKQRPIQIAWRDRIVNSMLEFSTANFTVHQIHYVAGNIADDGKDYLGIRFIKSYCEAKGGIYPDKTFNAPNPKGDRTDCVSLANGKLLFSFYTFKSSKFPLVTGGSSNYNVFGLVVPKATQDIDPANEVKVNIRDLVHNYLPNGMYHMPSLEAK